MLQEAIGADCVEDTGSFFETVSTSRDDAVVPVLLVAHLRTRLAGAIAGVYLRNLNVGMVLYAGVPAEFRRQGVYAALRSTLMTSLQTAAGGRALDSVITELEPAHHLFEMYVERLDAFVAPIQYEQPPVQGLRRRQLSLVIQPLNKRTPSSNDELRNMVREIYRGVYRLPNAGKSSEFLRVVESMYPKAR